MNIAAAWSAFAIEPFPDVSDRDESPRACLKLLDMFTTDCISTYVDNGCSDTADFRLLKRCVDDIELMLPSLTGDALLYFERLSGLGMCVLDRVGA